MIGKRSSTGFRAFWVLLAVGLAGLVVSALSAIVSGGYRAPADGGGFDLARFGLLVFFVAATGAFALVAGAGLVARRRGLEPIDLAALGFVVGLTIATAAIVPIVAILPAEAGHAPVPMLLRTPLYVGCGLMALAGSWSMMSTTRDALRRGDPIPLVALVLLAGFLAFLLFRD